MGRRNLLQVEAEAVATSLSPETDSEQLSRIQSAIVERLVRSGDHTGQTEMCAIAFALGFIAGHRSAEARYTAEPTP